jgi:hypothetical protein
MKLSKAEINERVEEGALHILVTFEVAGKPKKHVEETLSIYIKKLDEDKSITVLNVHKEAANELEEEEGYFSAFAEVEMLIKDLEDLLHLCINLMPASVEILAPDNFSFEAREMQNWSNDLLSRLHEIAQNMRVETQKSAYLNNSMRALLQNFIHVLLVSGPKNEEQLTRMTGVEPTSIKKILEELKDKKILTQEKDTWMIHEPQK